MRHFLPLLAATLLLTVPAAAQQKALSPSGPDRQRDYLLQGVRVDMTPAEVAGQAAAQQWTLVEESGQTARYRFEHRFVLSGSDNRLAGIYTIVFSNGKARAVSSVLEFESKNELLSTRFFDGLTAAMSSRAESMTTEKRGTVLTSTTTDGRTMRIVVNRVGPARIAIDAAVDYQEEEPLPLR